METLKERFEAALNRMFEPSAEIPLYVAVQLSGCVDTHLEAMKIAYNMALPQWVPIGERLPECNKRVLCSVSEDGELYSIFDSTYKGMNIFTSDGEYLTFVTHWMPLPPNPSKD